MSHRTILFICGGFEPGKDGVGDYTRLLAGELREQGYTVSIISLHDEWVPFDVKQISGDVRTGITSLRLPTVMPWKVKHRIVQDFITKQKPDIISLQYVLYGFQHKGLPISLTGFLKKLQGNHRWHIMFHELWVGKEDGMPLKVAAIAFVQRHIICRMIRSLQPAVIHTQLPAYKTKLEQLGFTVRELPLFSNIRQVAAKTTSNFENTEWQVAFFSQVGTSPALLDYLKLLQQQTVKAGKKLCIVLLGGSEQKMKNFKAQIQFLIKETTSIEIGGFLSPGQLSARLNGCVLGITPVSEVGLGKSGSVAAFIEHGLPVGVANREENELAFFDKELNAALVFDPAIENIVLATAAAEKARAVISLQAITAKFLKDLAPTFPSSTEKTGIVTFTKNSDT